MAFTILIFITAAAISVVAAYFSLVGLGSIFAATFWGVVIMGAALEVGKIVTTKWVHGNWRNPEAPWYFRGLLCFFIACLMAITSLGIYGYLSRGHLEQQAPLAGLGIQVAQLETQLEQRRAQSQQLQERQNQISRITDKSLETSGRAGLRAASSQRREAAEVQAQIDANNKAINDLNGQLVPLKVKTGDVQGELGVAKFIAEAFGWDGEKAIRIIISLIMAAFDPLALSMFIMGGISLKKAQEKRTRESTEEPENPPVQELEDQDPPMTNPVELDQAEREALREEVRTQFLEELEERARAERDTLFQDLRGQMDQERQEFQAAMEDAQSALDGQLESNEEQRIRNAEDLQALQEAHGQLVSMEERLNDERELLKGWEDQLTAQQTAINGWRPMDQRTPREQVIGMLEENPDVLQDIVDIVNERIPPMKPGL
jgi:hypothetical protein